MIKIQIYLAIDFEHVLANCLTKCWQVVTKSVRVVWVGVRHLFGLLGRLAPTNKLNSGSSNLGRCTTKHRKTKESNDI